MEDGFVDGVLEHSGSFWYSGLAEDLDVLPGDFVLGSSADGAQFLGQVEHKTVRSVFESWTKSSVIPIESFPGHSPSEWRDETTTMVPRGHCEGKGRVLAGVEESEEQLVLLPDFDPDPHAGAVTISKAPGDVVKLFFDRAYSEAYPQPLLRVGALLDVSTPVRARLIPDGFKRPTGLFGQSGSGKSFALGVIVEELALQTEANVVVLDPNGDFVRFRNPLRELDDINDGTTRWSVTQKELDEYRQVHSKKAEGITILSADGSVEGAKPILMRPSDLDMRETAAALKLDPVRDDEQYHLVTKARAKLVDRQEQGYGVADLRDMIGKIAAPYAAAQTLAAVASVGRVLRNVGFDCLTIWGEESKDRPALVSVLRDEKIQTVIVDLSMLNRLERALVSSVVFRTVWRVQEERRREKVERCTVLILDEAHHVFPAKTLFPEQELTADWGSMIAGEGRKYGVYLLIASQLPSKVHEHVLTQSSNMVLMRMVSQSDIDALQDSFSSVPETLLQRSKWFGKGEGLVIGDIVPTPCLLHFEGRKTHEGGRDLNVDWGEPAIVG